MKVRFNTMGKSPHSWSYVTQYLARAMLNIGNHEVYYKSTDGLENFPDDLKHILLPGYHGILGANQDSQSSSSEASVDYMTEDRQLIKVTSKNPLPEIPDKNMPYDLDFAYTIFYQAPRRFHPSSKMKALVWNFESSIIPYGWHLYHRAIDYILPSSQFSYNIFANGGVPKDKMLVVPHGVDTNLFNPDIPPFPLKTQKKVKFLHNAIPHARKCHDRVLKGYLDAFTGDDDVCLVMKTKFLTPDASKPFEVDVRKIIEEAIKGRNNLPEIEIVNSFVPDIGSLYTACDAIISMSSTEGFCLVPGTIIDTENGRKPIEDVKIGDGVVGHSGNKNVVSGVVKRYYSGEIVSIKRHGCFEWFEGTTEHPHLIVKRAIKRLPTFKIGIREGKYVPEWENLSNVKVGDFICIPKPKFNYQCTDKIIVTDYIKDVKVENGYVFYLNGFSHENNRTNLKKTAEDLNCSMDYVCSVANKQTTGKTILQKKILERIDVNYELPKRVLIPETILIDSELAEFFGLYIAEGSSFGNKTSISSHCDELYSHNLQDHIYKKLLKISYGSKIFGNGKEHISYSKVISKLLEGLFGKGFKNKRIPKELYGSKYITSILRGIFYGDGTIANGRYSFSTSSPQLCQDIFEILLSMGILCYIYVNKKTKNPNYILAISAQYNEKFNEIIKPIKYNNNVSIKNKMKNESIVENDEFFFVPVRQIKRKQYSGYVYNLHVEKDESYTSYGMATHNCLPLLEALACNSLVIAPRHGGQLDFLNDSNSLLANAGEMIAPQSMQYWHFDPKATVGDPDTRHFSELLRRTYENLDYEKNRIKEAARKTTEQFSWENAAQMILDLPIPKVPSSARLNYPKRKVLYIVPYAMAGGGEVWVREMIKKLDRNIYEPHIALVNGTNESLNNVFGDLNVTVEDLGQQGRVNALKCMIEAENYSLIHFYNSFGIYNLLKECWRQGVRVRIVETVHSDLVWPDAMVRVAKREDLICAIASVSNTMAKKLLKLGNKNVMVVPHVIDWDRFEGANRSKDILKEFGVPDGFVVGFVGRLSPEKNIPCVLQCAKSLPDISFVIVGGGPQEGPLKQMAKTLKNVFFIGERKDVEKFYAAFDVLMLSSSMEGLPLVILEAMATGTPIVASSVGAVSELVTDGINGYTIWNHNDYGLFSAAINKLKNETVWNQMSINSRLLAKAARERSEEVNINTLYNKLF